MDVGQDAENSVFDDDYNPIEDAIWQEMGGSQELGTEQGRRLEDIIQPATELEAQVLQQPQSKRTKYPLEHPGILFEIVQGKKSVGNPTFQLLDWCMGREGMIKFNLSDGKYSSWFIEGTRENQDVLKTYCQRKSVIVVTKYQLNQGSTIKIQNFEIKQEDIQEILTNHHKLIPLTSAFYAEQVKNKECSKTVVG